MKRIAPARESADNYRLKLMERRREVLRGLGVRFDTVASLGRVADDDRAQISHDEFLSLHRNRMDWVQLRLVDEALDRMEAGEYGICLSCEEPIAPKRLQAVSWARYCLKCQDALAGTDAA